MDGPYRYTDLQEDQVRFIRLCPRDLDNKIYISIDNEYLGVDRPLVYRALSYAWGDLERTNSIIVIEGK